MCGHSSVGVYTNAIESGAMAQMGCIVNSMHERVCFSWKRRFEE